MWPDLWKPDIIAHFQIPFYYIFIIYIPKCTFWLIFFHILKILKLQPYKVAVIERSICTVRHRENKPQVLPKTGVTYEWNEVRIRILYHYVCHELKNGLLGKLFFYSPASPQTKSKSMKKHRLWTTVSMSREQMAITYNSLGAQQPNKDFRAPLAWANTMIPRF